MSQSSLVNVTMLTNHFGYPSGKKGRGNAKIDKIFVHHMAGVLTVEQCGKVFKTREASAHYGIDSKGRVGQYVLEENAAWHCANKAYNQRSIGIELSNDSGAKGGWHVSDKAINKCVDLIVDICKRNNIKKINYTGDLTGNLCMHRWTVATSCPGPYLSTKFKYIASEVNKKLAGAKPSPAAHIYRVRKTWKDASSQIGAYSVLENAKKACKKGYSVFDEKGNLVYTNAAAKPSASTSREDKICAWAKKIADGGQYKYKKWTSDVKTHQCPICHNLTGKYKAWNCIGYAFASWKHGGGIPTKCSCGVVDNADFEKMLKASSDTAASKIAQSDTGCKDVKAHRDKNGVPASYLHKGDIIAYFDGNTYKHTLIYVGDGKISDCSGSQTPNIKYGKKYDPNRCKVVLRYCGK